MDPQLQQSGIFVLVIFVAVLAERGWHSFRRRRARSWPVAQGRIHTADWHQPRTGTNRYFLADISYYYFIDGHFYSGYHRRSFSKAQAASDWAKTMLGASIDVRYHPQIPAKSVLLEEDLSVQSEPTPELARGA